MTMEDISKQQIKNLLDDQQFIQWVLHPTQELDDLWEKRMNSDEKSGKDIRALKNIIENLRVKEPDLSENAKIEVWNRIEAQINRKKRKGPSYRLLVASAAASIIVLLGGYWLLTTGGEKIKEIDYTLYASENNDAMNSGTINLILSDNKRIDIEKDSTVIAYDAEGSVNIDSEKIEETVPVKDKPAIPELNQLIVTYGKTTSLILSDGTKVWVNSGSKLIYPAVFEKSKREVFISGEAFLEVARNEKAPFIVKTNNVELNVLGTSFNVSAYNDDITQSVVLVSGSVEIKSKDLSGSYKIQPNQMFSYVKDSNIVNIEKVDVANYVSWKYGYLINEKERLDNLFQKLSRHFNVTFVYNKQDFMKHTFSGKLDLKVSIQEILNYISVATANKLKYKFTDDNIHLTLSN